MSRALRIALAAVALASFWAVSARALFLPIFGADLAQAPAGGPGALALRLVSLGAMAVTAALCARLTSALERDDRAALMALAFACASPAHVFVSTSAAAWVMALGALCVACGLVVSLRRRLPGLILLGIGLAGAGWYAAGGAVALRLALMSLAWLPISVGAGIAAVRVWDRLGPRSIIVRSVYAVTVAMLLLAGYLQTDSRLIGYQVATVGLRAAGVAQVKAGSRLILVNSPLRSTLRPGTLSWLGGAEDVIIPEQAATQGLTWWAPDGAPITAELVRNANFKLAQTTPSDIVDVALDGEPELSDAQLAARAAQGARVLYTRIGRGVADVLDLGGIVEDSGGRVAVFQSPLGEATLLAADAVQCGRRLDIRLVLRTDKPFTRPIKIFRHALSADRQVAVNDEPLMRGLLEPQNLPQGKPFEDLAAIEAVKDALDTVSVGLYEAESGARLGAFKPDGSAWDQAAVRIPVRRACPS